MKKPFAVVKLPCKSVDKKITMAITVDHVRLEPTVSVVIPCYNGAKFLRETIDSVLAQTRPVLEIIVVDDGSTDDSAAIAESFGPPVRVIRQPNQGESVARNRGIEESKGEWVAYLDADDLWMPNKMEEQAKRMSQEIGFVCSRHIVVDQNKPGKDFATDEMRSANFRRAEIMEFHPPCMISSIVVRRDIPVRFVTWTKFGEDLLYFLDLVEEYPAAIVSKALHVRRLHKTNQTYTPDMNRLQAATIQRWLELSRDRFEPREWDRLSKAFFKAKKVGVTLTGIALS